MDGLQTHVALLRGVNVGGKNKLPMKELAALFGDVGCVDVRTYIQSGNVVFSAPADVASSLEARVEAQIERQLGLRVPVVLRSAAELAGAVEASPFADRVADHPKAVHVMFLKDRPTAAAVAALDPNRSPPDTYAVVGREVHLFCPNGVARTKLTTAWLDRALSTVSTARNWRTVLKLVEMSSDR